MWIKRNAETLIKQLAKQFPVVLVTGARQVGKTSILNALYPNSEYVSLDDPLQAARAEETPEEFLSSIKTPAIIDEVQYAPSLLRHIKMRVDEHKKPGNYFITGSQHFSLMHNVSESLAGRCGMINLMTLSFEEIARHAKTTLPEYICTGGYPFLHGSEYSDHQTWFPSYIATYLERDVRNIIQVVNLRDFSRFLRAVSLRSAQVLSLSSLARDVGIAPNTAKSWLSILQASHIIHLLEPYHRNMGKRLVKSPKLYFCDIGLLVYLLGIRSWDEITASPLKGAIWETYAFTQIYTYLHNKGVVDMPLWFWQTKNGQEIDFIYEKAGSYIAIEAKFNESPGKNEIKNFDYFNKIYGDNAITQGYVICTTQKTFPITKHIKAINGSALNFLK